MTITFNPSYAPMAKSTQYAAPDISKLLYEGIGNLPSDYYQGQQLAQQSALSQMFPQGLKPYLNPDGTVDPKKYADFANKAAQIGGYNVGAPALSNLIRMQIANQNAQRYQNDPDSGINQPPAYSPPQTASPASNTKTGTPGPQSTAAPVGGGDNRGDQVYVNNVVSETLGGTDGGPRLPVLLARKLGVDPSQPLTEAQEADARSLMQTDPQLTAMVNSIRGAAKADTDPASGPQPAGGQSEDLANVPRSTSAYERGVNGSPGPAPEAPVGGAGRGPVSPIGIQPNRVASQSFTPEGRIRITPASTPPQQGIPQGAPPPPPPSQVAQAVPPQGVPQPAPAVPQQGFPQGATPLQPPPGYGQARIDALGRAARDLYAQAARMGGVPNLGGPSTASKEDQEQANDMIARANKYLEERQKLIDSNLERSMPTTTQKEAMAPGSAQAITGYEGRKQFETERNKQFAEEAKNVNALAMRAQGDIDHLRDGSNQVDFDPNFYSGPLHQLAHSFYNGEWLLGGPRTANTANEMAIKEIANNELSVIRDLGNSGLGRILKAEVNTAQKTIMNMGQTPETVRKLFELGIRLREHMLMTKQILDQHNGYADDKFTADVIKYYQQNPLISSAEMEDPRLLAPPKIRYENDFGRLNVRPGDPFRYKDKSGEWRIKVYPGPKQQPVQ